MPNTIRQKAYRAVIDWIKTERQKSGQSMRAVAIQLDVPHTWIAKVESCDRRLDLLEYVRVCKALGLPAAQGLTMVEDQVKLPTPKAAAAKAAKAPKAPKAVAKKAPKAAAVKAPKAAAVKAPKAAAKKAPKAAAVKAPKAVAKKAPKAVAKKAPRAVAKKAPRAASKKKA